MVGEGRGVWGGMVGNFDIMYCKIIDIICNSNNAIAINSCRSGSSRRASLGDFTQAQATSCIHAIRWPRSSWAARNLTSTAS
jgi:hypothetical protein